MSASTPRVYFDHNATTYLRPEVLEAMLPFFVERFGNASSLHFFGQENRGAVDDARAGVAALIGADPGEIVFTSGGTESDNIAIRGVLGELAGSVPRPHVITSSIEHPAVLATCRDLERRGVDVTWLPCTPSGSIDISDIESAIRPETVLVSVMISNNETGVIQPVAGIAKAARPRGIVMHCDAVQGVGKIPVDVAELDVDLLSISAHKFYGPKGIGALYVRRGTKVGPVYTGGHQESGLRPGTENIPAIVGFGEACRIARERLSIEGEAIGRLRDRLEKGILERVPNVRINGAGAPRVPNTCNVAVPGIDGEALTLNLSLLGFALSSGSACATGDAEPSHVLRSMGLDPVEAQGALRISLGICNTESDVDLFLDTFPGVVRRLRALSPIR
ncbi:MAG: cysteine desulfurase family protein [Candidatus Krumholzibacteria bacterium]|nr:cysteine desulfurase family protein [Candidatus Krumholzibacteria bacterium]